MTTNIISKDDYYQILDSAMSNCSNWDIIDNVETYFYSDKSRIRIYHGKMTTIYIFDRVGNIIVNYQYLRGY